MSSSKRSITHAEKQKVDSILQSDLRVQLAKGQKHGVEKLLSHGSGHVTNSRASLQAGKNQIGRDLQTL